MTLRCGWVLQACAVVGTLVVSVALGAAAEAQVAYAWGNEPETARYAPAPEYSRVPGAGSVVIRRQGTGRYRVRFEAFGGRGPGGGHAIVGSYGDTGIVCRIGRWNHAADGGRHFDVDVLCHDTDGRRADSRFTVLAGWFGEPAADTAEPGAVAPVGEASEVAEAAELGAALQEAAPAARVSDEARVAERARPAEPGEGAGDEGNGRDQQFFTLDEIAQLRAAIRELDERVAELEGAP